MQIVELFHGAIRANVWLLTLDIVVLVHFVYVYYTGCYRKGYKLDFWHFTMFIGFVFPFLVLYPFAGSYANVVATGSNIYRIQDQVDRAYLITLAGYACTYLGYYYYDLTRQHSLPYLITDAMNRRTLKYMYNCVNNRFSLYACYLFGLVLAGAFLSIAFVKYGVSHNLRAMTLGDGLMRPFFNLILPSYIPGLTCMVIIRYLQYKERLLLAMIAIFSAITFLSGTRSAVLAPVVSAAVFYLIARRRQVNLAKCLVLALVILLAIGYLGNVRDGNFSPSGLLVQLPFSIAYGNNFSDIRDFAWVLSYWDNQYIYGSSYLAGIVSFVPRSLSAFRGTWSISIYTDRLVGFDPAFHPGLRPGKFGEAFLNFGMFGVALMGFVGGYVLRYTDTKIKEAVQSGNPDYIYLYSQTFLYGIVSQFYITAGFWGFYVFLATLALGYLARQLLDPSLNRHRHANTY